MSRGKGKRFTNAQKRALANRDHPPEESEIIKQDNELELLDTKYDSCCFTMKKPESEARIVKMESQDFHRPPWKAIDSIDDFSISKGKTICANNKGRMFFQDDDSYSNPKDERRWPEDQ